MRLAILGGTGGFGSGLALRWGRDTEHDIVIGSRDPDRAAEAAEHYRERLKARGYEAELSGTGNDDAVAEADVVVAAVPPYSIADAVESVADSFAPGTTLVSPAVGMRSDDDGMHYRRPGAGSVTALVADVAPDDVDVVGAFHSIPAARLSDLNDPLEMDTIVVGDNDDARQRVLDLAKEIDGMDALDGGPIGNAAEAEGLTALLINVGRYNEVDHPGFRVTR